MRQRLAIYMSVASKNAGMQRVKTLVKTSLIKQRMELNKVIITRHHKKGKENKN